MVVMVAMAWVTATERGLLMLRPSPRPMPGWDTVDSTATVVLALVMEVMAMVDLAMDMARGLLMLRLSLRPMPGWDMVDSTAMVSALVMEVMAMVDLATDMARGPLMLRLSRGWDTVDSTPTVVLVLAMVVMVATAMDCGKKYQIPRLII